MEFEESARGFRFGRIVFSSILSALSLVQALAWMDAFDLLVKEMLPIGVYGPASGFVLATLVTIVCVFIASFMSRCYRALEDGVPTTVELQVVGRQPAKGTK